MIDIDKITLKCYNAKRFIHSLLNISCSSLRPERFPVNDYYAIYETTPWNWVLGSVILTIIAYALMLIAAVILTVVITVQVRKLRQPLCVDCLSEGDRAHTPDTYNGNPVCEYHYGEREMADEDTYECPKHHTALTKHRRHGITIDVCLNGCVFLDDGELETLEDVAEESGHSSGQLLGLAIGIAV